MQDISIGPRHSYPELTSSRDGDDVIAKSSHTEFSSFYKAGSLYNNIGTKKNRAIISRAILFSHNNKTSVVIL